MTPSTDLNNPQHTNNRLSIAGKMTLLNQALNNHKGRCVAVIVHGMSTVEMSNSCICCTLLAREGCP